MKSLSWAVALPMRLLLWAQGPRRISAMLRVRDEEEFLYAAAQSIIADVDEMVIINNLSSDRTPQIMQKLQDEYPSRVRLTMYHCEIARRGREHWQLASTHAGRSSPHLSSNYYNWCLRQCRMPFVLKWDGDMIATPIFRQALQQWRGSGKAVLSIQGANIHPDRQHLIAARSSQAEELVQPLAVPVLPQWITSMSYTSAEQRLFPRRGARFSTGVWWTQTLTTPYGRPGLGNRFVLQADEPAYLHLRFCKRDPAVGYSDDFRQVVSSNLALGPELKPEWQELLQQWKA